MLYSAVGSCTIILVTFCSVPVVQAQAADGATCADDPTGELAAIGGCDVLLGSLAATGGGCNTDLNTIDPEVAPAGTLVKLFCPVSCGECPNQNDGKLTHTLGHFLVNELWNF